MGTVHFEMIFLYFKGRVKCTVCGRTLANMATLARHKKIHMEGSKERFKCDVCGRGFRDRTRLKVKHLTIYISFG